MNNKILNLQDEAHTSLLFGLVDDIWILGVGKFS